VPDRSRLPRSGTLPASPNATCGARPVSDSTFDHLFEDGPRRQQLGRYRLLHVLSEGAYSTVYRASTDGLHRHVVLKVLKPGPGVSLQARQRLRLEGQVLAQLKHPNLVQIYETFEAQGLSCLVLEYVAGTTLAARLGDLPISAVDAATLILRIARGVAAAHNHPSRIVHRDLKPANILLETEVSKTDLETVFGCVKVADFGIAKVLDDFESLTLTGQGQPGTYQYMAPEQVDSAAELIGPATDVHALGVLAYQLATGRHPFESDKLSQTIQRISHWMPPPPSTYRPELPPWFDHFCLRCLAKSPAERWPDAHQLAEELSEAIIAVLSSTRMMDRSIASAHNPTRTEPPGSTSTAEHAGSAAKSLATLVTGEHTAGADSAAESRHEATVVVATPVVAGDDPPVVASPTNRAAADRSKLSSRSPVSPTAGSTPRSSSRHAAEQPTEWQPQPAVRSVAAERWLIAAALALLFAIGARVFGWL
jgi:serine/threonine protein kinase